MRVMVHRPQDLKLQHVILKGPRSQVDAAAQPTGHSCDTKLISVKGILSKCWGRRLTDGAALWVPGAGKSLKWHQESYT